MKIHIVTATYDDGVCDSAAFINHDEAVTLFCKLAGELESEEYDNEDIEDPTIFHGFAECHRAENGVVSFTGFNSSIRLQTVDVIE